MTKCSEASAISYCCCALILLPEAGVVRAMQPFIRDHGRSGCLFELLSGSIQHGCVFRWGGRTQRRRLTPRLQETHWIGRAC